MMEHVNWVKGAITAVCAALTALWGWFGWLLVAWVALMAIDYVTGSAAGMRAGKWSSKIARDGILHKAGSIAIVLVAGLADMLLGTVLGHLPGIRLPWDYTILLCPVVVVWYALTEMGSIIENAVALGAPCPPWLSDGIGKMLDAVDKAGGGDDDGK